MTPYPIHVGQTFRLPPLDLGKPIPRHPQTRSIGGEPEQIISFRGESCDPGHIQWLCGPHHEERLWAEHKARGYTGPNQRLGDYFIREFARMGTERRQVVQFLVVGTGRIEQMPRSRFEKLVRPA